MKSKILNIATLSDRHVGVSPGLSAALYEAAQVCLDRHHTSPQDFTIIDNDANLVASVTWTASADRTRDAWANKDDTTEAAAYCLALANAELTRGLYAVRRAQGRSGVDYYLGPAGSPPEDLEGCTRLEVSGTDEGKLAVVSSRLKQKMGQAGRVASNLPALATVVAFELKRVKFLSILKAAVEDPESKLPQVVADEGYRLTFLKMTRNLAPTGKTFDTLDIRGIGDRLPIVLSPASRRAISDTLKGPSTPVDAQIDRPNSTVIQGVLRALNLDEDWLEVTVKGTAKRVRGVTEAVDDLIGPMVNHEVSVRVTHGPRNTLLFVDIEQDE